MFVRTRLWELVFVVVSEDFDLILMDIMLLGINGLEVLQCLCWQCSVSVLLMLVFGDE